VCVCVNVDCKEEDIKDGRAGDSGGAGGAGAVRFGVHERRDQAGSARAANHVGERGGCCREQEGDCDFRAVPQYQGLPQDPEPSDPRAGEEVCPPRCNYCPAQDFVKDLEKEPRAAPEAAQVAHAHCRARCDPGGRGLPHRDRRPPSACACRRHQAA